MQKKGKKPMTIQQRRERVEAAIREKGWDHQTAIDLAAETGTGWRTIYRDRDSILQTLADEEYEDLPRRRASFLADLRSLRAAAKADKSYSPAAKLLAMESSLLGLDRIPLPTIAEEDGPVDTSLEGVLSEVRKLRKRAMAGDSYVAAEKLLEREASLVESIRQRDEARAAEQQSHLDEAELIALFEAAAATLPEPVRAHLRVALGGS